jgi:hypothetical protein
MGTTVTAPMSVGQARRRLQDTSRLSSEQVDELERVVAAFRATRPRNQTCVACGSMRWSEHETADGDASWACDGCHRPSTLTTDEWQAQRSAAEAVRRVQDAAAAAAVPKPRDALATALTARLEAATVLARLEPGLVAARSALAAAQVRHDVATSAMQEAEAAAVTRLAQSVMGQRAEAVPITTGAARGALRQAEDGLQAARGARALLDDQLIDARRSLTSAEAAVRRAALAVLAEEELEPLIEQAIEARANYLEAVGALAWLVRNAATPNGDARAHQLVIGADVAPAQWPEAAHADGGMATRLAALVAEGGGAR